jgi:uncharacterized integral membrane protein
MAERSTRPGQGDSPPQARPRKRRSWRLYAAAAVAILTAILILQNSQSVEVKILFAETMTPLVFALLIAFALGALTGWLLPRVRHHKD